ncbi:chalcone isomerase family protein [Methylobacillus gramineus]|uniref:chalcone isomerase family protein n=1 Tax=Methylobacillus gramineus TaxID=755169 RepID=UPI001CFFA8F5|nr:chalcone isomerase family protein [Methylobacillus gramineus]MCB5185857.1 chalcone isomerase family protein [Methylobacillus gramineus]
MTLHRLLFITMLAILPIHTQAENPDYIQAEIPHAQIVGQGDLRWFGIKVYSAQLWAENGQYQLDKPHALVLTYGHDFSAKNLAKEGVNQLRKQGIEENKIKEWQPLMEQAFTDVKAGDTLTAIQLPNQAIRFYSNNKVTSTIDDADFTRSFLDIWLGPKTTEPKLRLKLINSH